MRTTRPGSVYQGSRISFVMIAACALLFTQIGVARAYSTTTIPVGRFPQGIAVNSSAGRAYVANYLDNNVSVIDETSHGVLATVNVGSGPRGVAVDVLHGTVLVTNSADGSVSVIGQSSNSVMATLAVGPNPDGIAVDPGQNRAYVVNHDSSNVGTISVIDTSTNAVVSTLSLGPQPLFDIVADPSIHQVYVLANLDTRIIDTTSDLPTQDHIDAQGRAVAVDTTDHHLYVAGNQQITVIDPIQNLVLSQISPGFPVEAIAHNPATGHLWVVGGEGACYCVSVLSDDTGALITTLVVTAHPYRFGVDAARGEVLVGSAINPAVIALEDREPFPPSAPTNVGASYDPAARTVTIRWQPPVGNGGSSLTGYRVYRFIESIGMVEAGTVPATSTQFVDSPPPICGGFYGYSVSAINDAGEGPRAFGPSIRATSFVPEAPPGATASMSGGFIAFSWDYPRSDCPITLFRIYRGTTSGGESLLQTITATTCTTCSPETWFDRPASPSTTYYYRVRAVSSVGEGLLSNEVAITTPSPPSPPINLSGAPGPLAGEISLAWSPPADTGGLTVDAYRIYRGTSPGAKVLIGEWSGSLRKIINGGLVNGTTYFYEISAVTAMGEGGRSNEAAVTTFSLPGAPLNPRAIPGQFLRSIAISWSAPANDGGVQISTFRIYRRSGVGPAQFIGNTGDTSWLDTGLTVGKSYSYFITAVNVVGEGPPSGQVCTRPFPWLEALGC